MPSSFKFLLPALFVLSFLLGLGIFTFFGNDAPDEVSLEAATGSLDAGADDGTGAATDSTVAADPTADPATDPATDSANDDAMADGETDAGADDGTGAAPAAGGIEGQWNVNTEIGTFDFQSATGSFVGFRIDEELQGVGATTAVGRTGDVSGAITVAGTTVTAADFAVDMTTITTDDARRDGSVQGSLDTDQFPMATFGLLEPIELGPGAATGEPVTGTAAGDLTINGIAQPIRMDIQAQLVDDTIVVVGSTTIFFPDFNVDLPSGGPVISVNESGIIELQLLLTR